MSLSLVPPSEEQRVNRTSGAGLPVLGWDEEAIANARKQASHLAERDPATAQMLLEQIQVELEAQGLTSERERAGEGLGNQQAPRSFLGEPLDLMHLIAQMGMRYPWMSREVISRMHFVTFDGYVREAVLAAEAEERALKEQQRNVGSIGPYGSQVTEGSLEQIGTLYPPAAVYEGDVVQYRAR